MVLARKKKEQTHLSMEQNGELRNKPTCSVAKSCHLYAKAGNKVSSMMLEKLSRNMQKNQTELLSHKI